MVLFAVQQVRHSPQQILDDLRVGFDWVMLPPAHTLSPGARAIRVPHTPNFVNHLPRYADVAISDSLLEPEKQIPQFSYAHLLEIDDRVGVEHSDTFGAGHEGQ